MTILLVTGLACVFFLVALGIRALLREHEAHVSRVCRVLDEGRRR